MISSRFITPKVWNIFPHHNGEGYFWEIMRSRMKKWCNVSVMFTWGFLWEATADPMQTELNLSNSEIRSSPFSCKKYSVGFIKAFILLRKQNLNQKNKRVRGGRASGPTML